MNAQVSNYHVGQHRLSSDERNEFNARLDMIMNSGILRNGEYSRNLSSKLVGMTGYKYAIPTDSGTSALAIIIAYLNREHRIRKVLAPAYTFQATYNAVAQALPRVLVNGQAQIGSFNTLLKLSTNFDVNLNISPSEEEIEWADLIVTVGLAGAHCDFNTDRTLVVEDACQDWITKPYTGNHRAISFDPSKTVSGLNAGGAILTDSKDLAMYASHAVCNAHQQLGWINDELEPCFGKRTITEVDALHVSLMLESVNKRLELRRALLSAYKEGLGDILIGSNFDNHDAQKALVNLPKLSSVSYRSVQEKLGTLRSSVRQVYQHDHLPGCLFSLPMSERYSPDSELITHVINAFK